MCMIAREEVHMWARERKQMHMNAREEVCVWVQERKPACYHVSRWSKWNLLLKGGGRILTIFSSPLLIIYHGSLQFIPAWIYSYPWTWGSGACSCQRHVYCRGANWDPHWMPAQRVGCYFAVTWGMHDGGAWSQGWVVGRSGGMDAWVGLREGKHALFYLRAYAWVRTFVLMHHCQNNLEACTTRMTELGIESLDMSAKCMEFVKRGSKEYKVLEVIVKGWKVKAVEVVSEAPPKKHVMCASKAKATDVSGTDTSVKVHLHDFLLALYWEVVCIQCMIERMSFTMPPPPPLPALCCTPCISRRLACKGALNATCQSVLAISVSTFTIFRVFGVWWHLYS